MQADGRRKVKSVKEYLPLFSRPNGEDIVIKKSADVGDTVKFIQEKAPETAWQAKKFAKFIKGNTMDKSCSNIWHWLYDHIPYQKDEEGIEQIRSPRRVVYEGSKTGVDCDCYSFFISCTLFVLQIPHKYRITKYPKLNGETPRWQHIYIVVPKDGKLDYELEDRNDYIVIDCVKDNYDDEEIFLEYKDYDAMRLDFLDGLDGEDQYPASVDGQALADALEDGELGKLKIGQFVKKAVHAVNRFTNPGTILLRNGFLLAMKENILNVAKRLRYAYLTDQQAVALNMDLSALAKLRKIKDKAESIYFSAGGKKESLKAAILKGRGNRDKKVPLSGVSGLGAIYADDQEYNIVNGLGDLGVVATTAIATAMTVITTLAGALKGVKGLFKSGTPGAKEMNSDTDAGSPSTIPLVSSESTDNNSYDSPGSQSLVQRGADLVQNNYSASTPATSIQSNASSTPATTDTDMTTTDSGANNAVTTSQDQSKQGFFQKASQWIKDNPGKAALIGAGVAAGAFMLMRSKTGGNVQGRGLSGIPKKKRRKKKKTAKPKRARIKGNKVRAIKIR